MTGSVIDGEDVVQDALMKAVSAYGQAAPIDDVEAWLFRIAHNAALDFCAVAPGRMARWAARIQT